VITAERLTKVDNRGFLGFGISRGAMVTLSSIYGVAVVLHPHLHILAADQAQVSERTGRRSSLWRPLERR
jgi:hypothetical protein